MVLSGLQCIHRDLKGENLLITSNERVKVTDFGFARIASRNADEMRRMTYCGTDVSWPSRDLQMEFLIHYPYIVAPDISDRAT